MLPFEKVITSKSVIILLIFLTSTCFGFLENSDRDRSSRRSVRGNRMFVNRFVEELPFQRGTSRQANEKDRLYENVYDRRSFRTGTDRYDERSANFRDKTLNSQNLQVALQNNHRSMDTVGQDSSTLHNRRILSNRDRTIIRQNQRSARTSHRRVSNENVGEARERRNLANNSPVDKRMENVDQHREYAPDTRRNTERGNWRENTSRRSLETKNQRERATEERDDRRFGNIREPIYRREIVSRQNQHRERNYRNDYRNTRFLQDNERVTRYNSEISERRERNPNQQVERQELRQIRHSENTSGQQNGRVRAVDRSNLSSRRFLVNNIERKSREVEHFKVSRDRGVDESRSYQQREVPRSIQSFVSRGALRNRQVSFRSRSEPTRFRNDISRADSSRSDSSRRDREARINSFGRNFDASERDATRQMSSNKHTRNVPREQIGNTVAVHRFVKSSNFAERREVPVVEYVPVSRSSDSVVGLKQYKHLTQKLNFDRITNAVQLILGIYLIGQIFVHSSKRKSFGYQRLLPSLSYIREKLE